MFDFDDCVLYYEMQGCTYVVASYQEYFVNQGRGIFMLVEATGNFNFLFSF